MIGDHHRRIGAWSSGQVGIYVEPARFLEFTGVLQGPDAQAAAQPRAGTLQYYVAGALPNHGNDDLRAICAEFGWEVLPESSRNIGGLRSWTVRAKMPPKKRKYTVEYKGYTMRIMIGDEPIFKSKNRAQRLNPHREKQAVARAPGWQSKKETAQWVKTAIGAPAVASTSLKEQLSSFPSSSWLGGPARFDPKLAMMAALQKQTEELQ